jgi:hypothetical protein
MKKIVAAAEAGMTVYIPAGNEKDVQILPPDIKSKLEIKLVSRVEEVLNDAILGYETVAKEVKKEPMEEVVKEPHLILDELENAIRKCIKMNLERLSKNWWIERIPPDIRQKAEERQKKDEMKRELIQYLDFADYVKIIIKRDNWRESFQAIFKDRELIVAKFKELEPIRNAVRHGRRLTMEEREKLKVFSRDIIRQILATEFRK